MMTGLGRLFPDGLGDDALLAARVLAMESTDGIPAWMLHTMDMAFMERATGREPGAYRAAPDAVYTDFQRKAGACFIDQYLSRNPLTMQAEGYGSDTERTATTGAEHVALDGIPIDSCEAVVEHLEGFEFPRLERAAAAAPGFSAAAIIENERSVQRILGRDILKVPYGGAFGQFPCLRYGQYGYAHYLTAFLAYPEVMERDFALQAEVCRRQNEIAARVIVDEDLPAVIRLDHDMADSRGTLVSPEMLESVWFPHFRRAVEPYLETGIRLIWHCDGNLMDMVPGLIASGVSGFQGFQYEDGMDYERICRMTDRHGGPLMIWAGVSVTRALPFGTPDDVKGQLRWLVEHGPSVGLCLGCSSSITPGVPWTNLETLIDGLAWYRKHGRAH